MRPIINMCSVDVDDPFPPVNVNNQQRSRATRQSLLPSSSRLPANRPSLTGRPSLPTSSRPPLLANKKISKPIKAAKSSAAKNNSSAKATAVMSSKKLSKIIEPDNEDAEDKEPENQLPNPVDSMMLQLYRESSIEITEKRITPVFDAIVDTKPDIEKLLRTKNSSGNDLAELVVLDSSLMSLSSELNTRRESLQTMREHFVNILAKHDLWLLSKMKQVEYMGTRHRELINKLAVANENCASTLDQAPKAIMVDKEVQVIPEKTRIVSPCIPSALRTIQLPASPILLTNKKTTSSSIFVPDSCVKMESTVLEITGTPKGWSKGDTNAQIFAKALNFDESTMSNTNKENRTDATYVISRPSTSRPLFGSFSRSISADQIQLPKLPVLLTEMRREKESGLDARK